MQICSYVGETGRLQAACNGPRTVDEELGDFKDNKFQCLYISENGLSPIILSFGSFCEPELKKIAALHKVLHVFDNLLIRGVQCSG